MIIYRSLTQKTPFEASLFWMVGSNGLTRAILFSGGCFTEVATYFKSHWKHCSGIESFISPATSRGEKNRVHKFFL